MTKELSEYNTRTFEDIKHIDKDGNEFWEARELMITLEYGKWDNFKKVIEKAKKACLSSNLNVDDHFADVGKIVTAGATYKDVDDYRLSRYACYLIVQNADPRKKVVALGQTYFAIQTRRQELNEEEFKMLSEDEKRLYSRKLVKNKNKYLFDTAKASGVINYAKFNNSGYKGLYGGETAKQIAARKGISEKDDILDFMGSTELGANMFRITQTDEILKNKEIDNEQDACLTHHNVGQAVRQTIKKLGGTMPEELPTPDKSIKQIEKERPKELDVKP